MNTEKNAQPTQAETEDKDELLQSDLEQVAGGIIVVCRQDNFNSTTPAGNNAAPNLSLNFTTQAAQIGRN